VILNVRLIILCLGLAAFGVRAQDAVRSSISNDRASSDRSRIRSETSYNLDLDPVKLRFNTSLSTEYNDNVNLAYTNALDDIILRPMLGIRAFWQVSERNALDFSLDLGYEHYFNGTRQSRAIVTGDENSGLFFDIYIGSFVINLHDRFSLSQDTSTDPTISGVAEIFRLENTAGTTITWDLNKAYLSLNYDHVTYAPLDDFYKYLAHDSDYVSLRPAVAVNPALVAGLELGAGITRYHEAALSNNRHTSVGPFVRYQVGKHTDLRVSLGFTQYEFDPSTYLTNRTTSSGLYADVQFRHQLTDRTSQSINLGQSQSTDINSSPVQLIYVRYGASLNIIRYWSIRPQFTFEAGSETRGLVQEDFERYGGGLSIHRQITDKLSGELSWFFLKKDSSVTSFSYTQNRLVLNVAYQF
jgi:hypothetical protein